MNRYTGIAQSKEGIRAEEIATNILKEGDDNEAALVFAVIGVAEHLAEIEAALHLLIERLTSEAT